MDCLTPALCSTENLAVPSKACLSLVQFADVNVFIVGIVPSHRKVRTVENNASSKTASANHPSRLEDK